MKNENYLSKIVILIFVITVPVFSQIYSTTERFPLQDNLPGPGASSFIDMPDGDLMILWYDKSETGGVIKSAESSDGITWSNEKLVTTINSDYADSIIGVSGICYNDGKLLAGYQAGTMIKTFTSIDSGNTWQLNDQWQVPLAFNMSFQINEALPGVTFLIYNNRGGRIIRSFDKAMNWEDTVYRISNASGFFNYSSPEFFTSADTLYALAWRIDRSKIFSIASTDTGKTWVEDDFLSYVDPRTENVRSVIKGDTIYTIYDEPIENEGFQIRYNYSYDKGMTWTNGPYLTRALSNDMVENATLFNNEIVYSYISDKVNRGDIWLAGVMSEDAYTPPQIRTFYITPFEFVEGDSVIVVSHIVDDSVVTSAYLDVSVNGVWKGPELLYDDGSYPDAKAGDHYYSAYAGQFNIEATVQFKVLAYDNLGNYDSLLSKVYGVLGVSKSYAMININNLKLPINNRGTLANVSVPSYRDGGWYDEHIFLFSGGFYIGGTDGATKWAFAEASASRDEHVVPGQVGSDPDDIANKVFVVRSSDPPFGKSWIDWKYAVEQGAEYFDGDLDSVYNPVDKNGNGRWDSYEDAPIIFGDLTAFCVYNDGKPSELRGSWADQIPRGIEIRQTLYGFDSQVPEYANSLFIRYELINTGTVSPAYDSVYFGFWADSDVGEYWNNLVGCDTILQTGYCYNRGYDLHYGVNPPAFFITPLNFMPGVQNVLPDEKVTSSFIHYMNSHSTLGDPRNSANAYNYLHGRMMNGDTADPCNWGYGTVYSGDCKEIDPKYWYSGSPIHQTGWVNALSADQRMMVNSAPFTLTENEPVELYAAYTVGRGTDSLNSIAVGKKYIADLKGIPWVSIDDNKISSEIPSDFALSQNYPNPFNPVTTINYQLPAAGKVTLKVYNILGQEVKTLVNDVQEAGYKTVEFDASKLASGVYIYRISVENTGGSKIFTYSKKMVLIK